MIPARDPKHCLLLNQKVEWKALGIIFFMTHWVVGLLGLGGLWGRCRTSGRCASGRSLRGLGALVSTSESPASPCGVESFKKTPMKFDWTLPYFKNKNRFFTPLSQLDVPVPVRYSACTCTPTGGIHLNRSRNNRLSYFHRFYQKNMFFQLFGGFVPG